jgi:hypothetical protein
MEIGHNREIISRRRAFRVFGSGILFGLAAPGLLLAASNAEAQTAGMERRQDRRDDRRERREDRRTDRQDRREDRRTNRQDRRDQRRPGGKEYE